MTSCPLGEYMYGLRWQTPVSTMTQTVGVRESLYDLGMRKAKAARPSSPSPLEEYLRLPKEDKKSAWHTPVPLRVGDKRIACLPSNTWGAVGVEYKHQRGSSCGDSARVRLCLPVWH